MSRETPGESPFDEGTHVREVALIALYAAVLTRRIFDTSTASPGMRPADSQILLALALTGSLRLTDPPGESVRGLATMLALEDAAVLDSLQVLARQGLAQEEKFAQEQVEDDRDRDSARLVVWELTREGRARAVQDVEKAARHLPGWPPAHRAG